MRIVVHDFGGYAFPAQLSRQLARSGHQVLHLVCAEVFSGKAHLRPETGDSKDLEFEAVPIGTPLQRYRLVNRVRSELVYGGRLARRINDWRPDVVISANTPLFAQQRLFSVLDRRVQRVIWLQDLVSVAISGHLRERNALAGAIAAPLLERLEIGLARRADHTVVITPDFVDHLVDRGVERGAITEIRNWAPVEDLPVLHRENEWRARQPFRDDFIALYTGTLGLKHDPGLLAALARRAQPGCSVVVLAEGPGADWLRAEARSIPNLHVLDYVDYDELPQALAAADVLLALLEPAAATFSVPSKILTYLCAGRPIVAALPAWNLAAQILTRESGGGIVVQPGDADTLVGAVTGLLADATTRERLGASARRYAESTFDIQAISARFEAIIGAAELPSRPVTPVAPVSSQNLTATGAISVPAGV